MSNVIFALPRTEYGSYQDLYSLIRLNGFPTVYFDEIDPSSDNCYIMTCANGENTNGWEAPRAKIVLWDFEHRIDQYPRIPGCAEYWHMDAAQARQHQVRYMPMGGDARLKLDSPPEVGAPKFDVCYMAYLTHRRNHVLGQLLERGVRIALNAWGEHRHQNLLASTAYLHVHQLDNAPAVPALRMVVAAAYRLPVITETFSDAGIFVDMAQEVDYSDLAVYAQLWTRGYQRVLAECGEALYGLLCEDFTFRKGIEAAV